MIAATDPQEFIPSGRQQALNHPGPVEPLSNKQDYTADDFLLQDFEKVSIIDSKTFEWWMLRKTPNLFEIEASTNNKTGIDNGYMVPESNKSRISDTSENSWSSRSIDPNVSYKKRVSDVNTPKFLQKRFSSEIDGTSANKSLTTSTFHFKTYPLTCKPTLNFMEEELYVKGNIVIWSKGLSFNKEEDTTHETLCTYSSTYLVKHALWCNFYCEKPTIESPLVSTEFKPDEPLAEPISCVGIIDGQNFKVFTVDNEDFITALPFQVKRVWNIKFGILLERDISDESNRNKTEYASPMIYSLSHPLDEIAPVGIKLDAFQLIDDPLFQVVYTSENPSICMIYDGRSGRHSVYKIRRLLPTEWIENYNKSKNQTQSMLGSSYKQRNYLSFWDNYKSSAHLSVPSPYSSRAPSVTSIISQMPSRAHSPMTSTSRCHTPTISISLIGDSPSLLKSSRLNSLRSIDYNFGLSQETIQFDGSHISYINPNLYFEHIWTDSVIITNEHSSNGAASKVFLIDDMIGQWYLCYLVPCKTQLLMVKVEMTSTNSLSFGMATSIGAKDAIEIPSLHMLAILEHSGNVVLYSGLNTVGKLHTGGVLPQHIPSPCVRQNLKQFNSPFPRRSSLLPTCGTSVPDLRFDEHLLSPVLPTAPSSRNANPIQLSFQSEGPSTLAESSKIYLSGLRDPIENRITLQYSDGTYYRINLPLLATSKLVENCLNALRETLSRDASMTLLTRWYSARNAPGPTDVTAEKEWDMFSNLLFQLLGYAEEQTTEMSIDHSATPSSSAKRLRQSRTGGDTDWAYLLKSEEYKQVSKYLGDILHLNITQQMNEHPQKKINEVKVNHNANLFANIRIVQFTLHLLYEELKLNVLRKRDLKLLADFLSKISYDLDLDYYQLHYWKDFPEYCDISNYSNRIRLNENQLKSVICWPAMNNKPCGIFDFLFNLLHDNIYCPYPYLHNVNPRSKDVIQLWSTYVRYTSDLEEESYLEKLIEAVVPAGCKAESLWQFKSNSAATVSAHRVIELMTEMGLTNRELETYPVAINLLLYDAIWRSREKPPSDWPAESYTLLQRPDLATQAIVSEKKKEASAFMKYVNQNNVQEVLPTITQVEADQEDGMEDVDSALLKLRFPEDLRVAEARRLLQSSKPVSIVVVQRPDVSDHDFIEEQEKHLYALCTRTMALPVGRGMFTLRTASPVITEPLGVPPLCLSGKAPPRGTTVELTHIDTPPTMNLWPLFHNGVANGLRITPEAHNIDSTWIVFNRPKGNSEMEHAGFLMALGLNGHLKNLDVLNTFDYLAKFQEMVSVGVLLGLSAAYRGSSNMAVTKMLSIHIEALLPPTSMELDISQNVQVAGLLGIGLLYQGTAHRHMTEVLLTEIGRPPGPEMENSIDRESYSLAAGLALGLVTLGQGGKPSGLSDLNVPDTLHYYMVGGNRRPLTGSQKDKYKVASFLIREGSTVNLDVTAPGATLALGLMYIGSGNKAVADWMSPPDTQYLLDFIRPDFLILRTLSRALIMWNDIQPTKDWIDNQVPETIRPFCMVEPSAVVDIDYEAMNQAYCNIIAGACFALGLRYAGSADADAFQTLLHYCHMFTSLTMKSIAELAGKPTIETCLNLIVISAAMVMAGTGNLEIMRIVRHLRKRVGVTTSVVVTYGSHLATHMALGLLFLGGGRYTLSNSPASVASLICAFYPKFPIHSNDNRYHLQAFRHLYVLAVEPRLLIPRDIMMGRMCYANIKVIKIDGTEINIRGPGLIPELSSLYKVCIDDERYWPVVFERGRNWDLLEKLLKSYGCIEVKQRAGCLSYLEDKHGYRTELAHTLTQSSTVPWDPSAKAIVSFSSDCTIRNFCDYFLSDINRIVGDAEAKTKQNLTKVTYDCVVKDKLNVLPIFVSLLKVMRGEGSNPNFLQLWQFKLAHTLILKKSIATDLISPESILGLHQNFVSIFDRREKNLKKFLKTYILGQVPQCKGDLLKSLVSFIIFYDIPFNCKPNKSNYLENVIALQSLRLSSETIMKLMDIVG